jgi:hypothetical protein
MSLRLPLQAQEQSDATLNDMAEKVTSRHRAIGVA